MIGRGRRISSVVAPGLTIGADAGNSRASAFYLFVAILIWNLAAMSLVFKRALEISTPLSAMLSFGYFVAYYLLVISFL